MIESQKTKSPYLVESQEKRFQKLKKEIEEGTYTGRVMRRHFSMGSKSERDVVVLQTDDDEFALFRRGGNPFWDDILDELVGKSITCSAIRYGNTVIMIKWEVV